MRLDYTLYIIAAVFFIIAVASLVLPQLIAETERNLWIAITVVLGLLSIGLGYYQKPKTKAQACQPTVSIS